MFATLTIVLLFAAAWAVSRLSALVARKALAWQDRRHHEPSGDLRAKIVDLKRRETTVAVIRTGIAYIAFAAALVLTAAQLTGGFGRLTAVAGASFILILVGFSAQRMLMDIIAGFNMFIDPAASRNSTSSSSPATGMQPSGSCSTSPRCCLKGRRRSSSAHTFIRSTTSRQVSFACACAQR